MVKINAEEILHALWDASTDGMEITSNDVTFIRRGNYWDYYYSQCLQTTSFVLKVDNKMVVAPSDAPRQYMIPEDKFMALCEALPGLVSKIVEERARIDSLKTFGDNLAGLARNVIDDSHAPYPCCWGIYSSIIKNKFEHSPSKPSRHTP